MMRMLLLLVLMTGTAYADPLTVTWSGSVTNGGTAWIASAVLDTTAIDGNDDPHAGYYPSAIQSFLWQGLPELCGPLQGVTVQFNVSTANPAIPFVDSFSVKCGRVKIQLTGPAGIFSNDSLPLTFDIRRFPQTAEIEYNGLASYGTVTYVGNIATVPEPSTLLLAGVGIALRGFRRLRRHPR